MSTSLSQEFAAAAVRFLHAQGRTEAVEVLSWYEDHDTGGFCETCVYDEWTVDIKYRTGAGDKKNYTYYGQFADLLKKLLDA